MSSVSYSLKNRGVRLVSADEAWVATKDGGRRLNPKYQFVGKIDTKIPNMVISTSDKRKPSFRGDTADLNSTAKRQIVDHFYDENGRRNRRTVAYFGIEKQPPAGTAPAKAPKSKSQAKKKSIGGTPSGF